MAHQAANYTPTALASVTAGSEHLLQNTGSSLVHVAIGTTAPGRNSRDAFTLAPGATLRLTPGAGESLFVWTRQGFSDVVYEPTG